MVVGTVVGTQQFPNEMDPTLFLVRWNYWWQTQRPLGNLDHTVISNDWHHLEQDIFYSISISTVCINTGSSITMFVSRRVYSPVLLGFSRPARYRQNGAPKHMVFLDYWPNHIISQSWATGMSYISPFHAFVGYSTVQYMISTMNPQYEQNDEQKNVRVAWAYWYPTVGGI